jgi:hypothetical protein
MSEPIEHPDVHVQCNGCGGLAAIPAHLFSVTRPAVGPPTAHYVCPLCRHPNVKALSDGQLAVLAEAGIRGAADEGPPARPVGAPLTWDDLLDFGLALASTDDLAEEARR